MFTASTINQSAKDHWNIKSLPNGFDKLKLIVKNKVDIFVITETKFDSSVADSQVIIDDFRQPYCFDRNRHGGFVLIFVRRHSQQVTKQRKFSWWYRDIFI